MGLPLVELIMMPVEEENDESRRREREVVRGRESQCKIHTQTLQSTLA